MHLGGFEEGDGEGLLVLGAVPAYEPSQLGVDALSCKNDRLGLSCVPAGRITQGRAAACSGSLLGMALTLQTPTLSGLNGFNALLTRAAQHS